MEILCKNIANKIGKELNFDNDKREVIAYGTFAFLQILLNLLLVIIFGFLFHVLLEALIVSFSIVILRKYSGGAHASSPSGCTAIGTIVCVVQALIITIIASYITNFSLIVILGLIIFIWSYYLILKLAPVDNVNKTIKSQAKRYRMKKDSILILSAYAIIVIINAILYKLMGGKLLIVYTLCIYGGILWQVFTLTKNGHLLLAKIDTILYHLVNIKRR